MECKQGRVNINTDQIYLLTLPYCIRGIMVDFVKIGNLNRSETAKLCIKLTKISNAFANDRIRAPIRKIKAFKMIVVFLPS